MEACFKHELICIIFTFLNTINQRKTRATSVLIGFEVSGFQSKKLTTASSLPTAITRMRYYYTLWLYSCFTSN